MAATFGARSRKWAATAAEAGLAGIASDPPLQFRFPSKARHSAPQPHALRFRRRGVRRSRAPHSRIYSRGCAAYTPRSAAGARQAALGR